MLSRRSFFRTLAGAIAAPAIVKFDALMPVKSIEWLDKEAFPLIHQDVAPLIYQDVALGYAIRREEIWDNLYAPLFKSFQETKEICAANVFNGSFGYRVPIIRTGSIQKDV